MLKTALIGYGYWGSKLARNFNNIEDFDLSNPRFFFLNNCMF